ncbi:MAG: 23S rRNA (pseudouridine(1915)-N(3))-methyltransferase RlmH [Candidatus Cloacimonetes bacterium]|nr:23S rRNA (pseudouridine(1915)-N(3))-methyltransferase RlmH [Candidatus Cloacimonadota bacterium]
MTIRLLFTGKTKQDYIQSGINEYIKRCGSYVPVKIDIIPDVKLIGSRSVEQVTRQEAESLLKALKKSAYTILLDESGTSMSSTEFASFLEPKLKCSLQIIIAGVYGADNSLHKRADTVLSLSSMTFTHQMARLIISEQLYRALTIINGKKYHY